MKLRFFGATRHVTGSCFLLEAAGLRLLIDCGMFQEREHLAKNWEMLPVPPEDIHCLLLTHAHLDHSGLIPRVVRAGFQESILATRATADLAKIVLHDTAHIQEEDAAFKRKRHGRQKRRGPYPVVPLYTAADVDAALPLFRGVGYGESVRLSDDVAVTFHDAGHILGSAMIELTLKENGQSRTVIFSGDIGQWDKPIVRDPTLFEHADYVVMESTYGGRNHQLAGEIDDQLCAVINETAKAGGNIVIPTFAIERAQELMYHIRRLVQDDRIPDLLVFLDSPMAASVTDVFRRHRECMDEEALSMAAGDGDLFRFPGLHFTRDVSESKAINRIQGSCIIMAGSGMCTAGRVKHHLVNNISRPNSTILFVGYQANNTLGRHIVDGKPVVRIHGEQREVRARIELIHGLSAHADQRGLLKWIGNLKSPPREVFLAHGDEDEATALASRIQSDFGWKATVPEYDKTYHLG